MGLETMISGAAEHHLPQRQRRGAESDARGSGRLCCQQRTEVLTRASGPNGSLGIQSEIK
jgi:hypothetical protein